MKVKYIAFITLILLMHITNSNKLAAQDSAKINSKSYKFAIAIQPLYLYNAGVRIDFDKRIKNTKQWLQFSVKGYASSEGFQDLMLTNTDNSGYYNYGYSDFDVVVDNLRGLGFEVGYKRSLHKADLFYFSTGLSYSFFDVKYATYGYVKFIEDELTFYRLQEINTSQQFNNLGTNFCLGVQSRAHRSFFIDTYIGLGANYSFYNDSKKQKFNDNMYNVGYRGLSFLAGFRIGLRFGNVK